MTRSSACKTIEQDNDEYYVQEYSPLVKRIAQHLLFRLPSNIALEDLVQAGLIGLLEAVRKFDKNKGASFTTYAGIRIRGAMLDEVRKIDWAPRSVHKNNRDISKAMQDVENETGRDAKDAEIAARMQISLKDYHQMLNDTNCKRIFCFEDLGVTDDVISTHGSNEPSPLEGLQREDIKKNLGKEISRLPKREKLVLALYYDEELNLREVGDVLGVSESRISQIHSQAMVRLQARMGHWT